ncbi:MAG: acyltransferase [Flavobacteriaceae bacterium]|nr:acyltransferase [Flavobacteriaceae bacterium]
MFKDKIVQLFLKWRKIKFSFFSNSRNITGNFTKHQPVVMRGKGTIIIGNNVNIGVINSPFFYNGYGYVEARKQQAVITFGDNIHINNNFSVVSERKITINSHTLIGYNCTIIDSNFHNLTIDKRLETDPNPEEVIISENVFIGNNVTILKGVTIGKNTVVANGAMVTKSCPENVVIGGVPAKVISKL